MTGAYAAKEGQGQISHQFDNHQLSLLFIVLAMGALHSLELPQNDPSAEEYLDLAKRSLAKSDFLTHSTVAAIQTLVGGELPMFGHMRLTSAYHGPLSSVRCD